MCFNKGESPDLDDIRAVVPAIADLDATYAHCQEKMGALAEQLEKNDGMWGSNGIVEFAKSNTIEAAQETCDKFLTIISSNPLPQMEQEAGALVQQMEQVMQSAGACREQHERKKSEAAQAFPHAFIAQSDAAAADANINKNDELLRRFQQLRAVYEAFPAGHHDARIRDILADKKNVWRKYEDSFLQGNQEVKNFMNKVVSINDEAKRQAAFVDCKKATAEKEHLDAHSEEVITRIKAEEATQELIKALQRHQEAKLKNFEKRIQYDVLDDFATKMITHSSEVEGTTNMWNNAISEKKSIMEETHQTSQTSCEESQQAVNEMTAQTTRVAYGNAVKSKQLADATRKVINANVRRLERQSKLLKEELRRARNEFRDDGDDVDERIQEIREEQKKCATQQTQLELLLEEWEDRGIAAGKRKKAFKDASTVVPFDAEDRDAKQWVANVMPPEDVTDNTDIMLVPEVEDGGKDDLGNIDVRSVLERLRTLEIQVSNKQ
eukprot:GEMP01011990.1.p1 GENE.GEMP01011990.1~~GEMP01011990.1.p1  ORF type:complete len:507 (+),score=135.95 GEMP01011990.1:38-1522(+)